MATRASRETGKERWSRIPLDYYKRADWLARWKAILAAIALAAALGWWASGLEWNARRPGFRQAARARLAASHGALARVHAAWDSNCEACHVPGQPIRDDVWTVAWAGAKVTAERCQACHAGPPHHACALDSPGCTRCHRDHRGRDASLVRVADANCVECHGELSAHMRGDAECAGVKNDYAGSFNHITRFDRDHPEFRALERGASATDRGKLKFNHALHMSKGLALEPDSKPVFVLGMIREPRDRKRYALPEQSETDPVQLDCASCHRTDAGDFGETKGSEPALLLESTGLPSAILPARSSGADMQMITYELHCRACHELRIEPPAGDKPLSHAVTIRHRVQPSELHATLEEAYLLRFLASPETPAGRPHAESSTKSPVRTQSRAEDARSYVAASVLEREQALYLEKRVADAEKILYLGKQTCSECHFYDTADGTVTSEKIRMGSAPAFRVAATDVPQVWLPHARFDHSAHRAIDCRECHARAYPDGRDASGRRQGAPSLTSADVLIPGVATCRACHSPPTRGQGGAAFDCTECHRYHQGDRPLQGRGAKARDAQQKLTIQQFLSSGGQEQ